jgi:hypothetical protein
LCDRRVAFVTETCRICSVMLMMGTAAGEEARAAAADAAAAAASAAAAADDDDGANAGCDDSAEAVAKRVCIARDAS